MFKPQLFLRTTAKRRNKLSIEALLFQSFVRSGASREDVALAADAITAPQPRPVLRSSAPRTKTIATDARIAPQKTYYGPAACGLVRRPRSEDDDLIPTGRGFANVIDSDLIRLAPFALENQQAAEGFAQARTRLQSVRPAQTKQRHAVTTDAAMPAEVDPFLAARLRLQHQAVN
jgi:hypothetical protein